MTKSSTTPDIIFIFFCRDSTSGNKTDVTMLCHSTWWSVLYERWPKNTTWTLYQL